jgi:hypothetical protein
VYKYLFLKTIIIILFIFFLLKIFFMKFENINLKVKKLKTKLETMFISLLPTFSIKNKPLLTTHSQPLTNTCQQMMSTDDINK